MAEDSGGEKNLPASGRKKEKAREEGNIARSQDLGSALALAVALFMFLTLGGRMMHTMTEAMRYYLGGFTHLGLDSLSPQVFTLEVLYFIGVCALPFMLALLAAGIAVNLMQVGFIFTTKPLQPNLGKLNPLTGMGRFFSARAAIEAVKSLAKLALVAWLVYLALRGRLPEMLVLAEKSPEQILAVVGAMIASVWWRVVLAMIVLGIFDYGYQFWQREQDLRMTAKEAKEEMKEMEGDPLIKRRIRQIQRQAAMQRMMKEVPKADVIITNPTHYAVALRYDMKTMNAPVVVAKGARLIAHKIRDIAAENNVPIVQKPELARAIFKTIEIGQAIPEDLFQAVAEVLSFVYHVDSRSEKIRERQTAMASGG